MSVRANIRMGVRWEVVIIFFEVKSDCSLLTFYVIDCPGI